MGATFKRLLMPIFLLLIGGGIFIGLLAKEGIPEVIATLAAFGLAPFILYVGISLANFALYAHRWQVIVNKGQAAIAKISFFRLYLHRMSGYAFMYLLPLSFFGSEPVRVGLLHEDGVPLNRATSSVLIDLAFETMAFILFIAVGLILALVEGVTLGNAGTIVASALVLFAAVIITFYVGTVSGKG
ncbi:MAG: lysylphosphatidylglycerol synthase domain-containing protein, partial [Patescibacteria group bacterium]